jgi:hypothetical protein
LIASLDQVTPEWLTAVLTNSGALTHGAVAGFDLATGRGNWSTSGRLHVRYSDGSRGARPQRLFLKLVNVALDGESFGPSEVTYYTRDYVDVTDAPLVRCYDGVFSEAQQRYHLLLDDLSETHVEACAKAPTLGYGLALAEGLAAMHARWWGEQRLAEAGAPIHTAAHIRRFVAIAEPGVGHIVRQFSAELKPHWPETIRAIYAQHPPAIIARTRDANGFTLIHGDAYCTNILAPREAEQPTYLLDRQPFNWSLTTWLGVYDLAYVMTLDWEVKARRRLELPVLRHYHAQLLQRDVTKYPWERLFDDYRLCVAMGVYIATEYCRGGVQPALTQYWLPKLQRSLTACDDLECRQLWQPT